MASSPDMPPIHHNLAAGAWQKLPMSEQMGNSGSEGARVLHWQAVGENTEKKRALGRAFELLDLTLADPRFRSRTTELARLREVLCDVFAGKRELDVSTESLEDYF